MYYIIEIQQYKDGTYGHQVHWAQTRNQGESKYHEVLAAAAVSDLPSHSATLIDSRGLVIMNWCYEHEQPEEASE